MQNNIVCKRTFFSMLTGIVGAPFAGFVAIIIASFFVEEKPALYAIGTAIAVLILFVTIFGENIRVEADEKELRYFKRNKLRECYALENLSVGYRARTESGLMGNNSFTLRLLLLDTQEEKQIDCSPIGQRQFFKLYEYLEARTTPTDDEVLTAK